MKRVPMTALGAAKLREELQHLKTVRRPEIVAAIAEARAHGDLKENAEYHSARELHGFNEGRIHEIEAKLALAEVIDVVSIENSGRVIFGVTVELLNLETEEKVAYQIVGEDEANIKHAKISVTSPIARALIGKELEDCVEVVTPGGVQEFEIMKIEHI